MTEKKGTTVEISNAYGAATTEQATDTKHRIDAIRAEANWRGHHGDGQPGREDRDYAADCKFLIGIIDRQEHLRSVQGIEERDPDG